MTPVCCRWELCGPFINTCKRLLSTLITAEPKLIRTVADRKKHQMAKLARALRVNPDRKEGEAFDRELQEQRKQERIARREEQEQNRRRKREEWEAEDRSRAPASEKDGAAGSKDAGSVQPG